MTLDLLAYLLIAWAVLQILGLTAVVVLLLHPVTSAPARSTLHDLAPTLVKVLAIGGFFASVAGAIFAVAFLRRSPRPVTPPAQGPAPVPSAEPARRAIREELSRRREVIAETTDLDDLRRLNDEADARLAERDG